MAVEEAILETMEYQVVLVRPDSRTVLALATPEGYRLPSVCIPLGTRPAEQLCKAIQTKWGLHVFVLDFLVAPDDFPRCAVAELLVPGESAELRSVTLPMIARSELSERSRSDLASLLSGDCNGPVSQMGWIDEAIAWMEAETQKTLLAKDRIEQYNAGGEFALVCFYTTDDSRYWLKATGEPNTHEFPVTQLLSELGGAHLPELIATKPSWNAWLMPGAAGRMTEQPAEPYALLRLLEDAVESMARLQIKTIDRRPDLLNAGAFEQGTGVLLKHSEALFNFLEEAMSLQTSAKVPPIAKSRLQEIRMTFEDACRRMEDLDLPETIVHGDMNRGNILVNCGHCQFIDWCEAYVGNPLIGLEHLLLLNKVEEPERRIDINRALRERYRATWSGSCNSAAIDEGFLYMPLLAIASTLYGRGDWLASPQRNDRRRQSYARSLARHMDRAVREPELLEATCR